MSTQEKDLLRRSQPIGPLQTRVTYWTMHIWTNWNRPISCLDSHFSYLNYRRHGDIPVISATWATAAVGMSQWFQLLELSQPWGCPSYFSYLGYRSRGDVSVISAIRAIAATRISQLSQPWRSLNYSTYLGYRSYGDVSAIPASWATAAMGIFQLSQLFGLPQPWGYLSHSSYSNYHSHIQLVKLDLLVLHWEDVSMTCNMIIKVVTTRAPSLKEFMMCIYGERRRISEIQRDLWLFGKGFAEVRDIAQSG